MDEKEKLTEIMKKRGFPEEFGRMVANELKSDKAIDRMIGYILSFEPTRAEDIADELLAIRSDIERWQQKKTAEYYNSKYNELLSNGLE